MKTRIPHLLGLILVTFFIVSFTGHVPNDKKFNIHDYAWLAGTWIGDGLGGISEEIWSVPSLDSTMMGMFRHLKEDGSTTFYEFMILDKNGIRLKHFNPDLTGWEEKERFVSFEMLGFTSNKIEMNGLTYEKKSDMEMEVQVDIQEGGKILSEIFKFTKSEDRVKKLSWLIGTWESKSPRGTLYETWTKLSDNELSGKSFSLKNKDTVVFETIRIVQEKGGLFYIPTVKNQNNNLPVRFALKSITPTSFVFENQEHDFPQTISYVEIDKDSLVAEISGIMNGQERKPMFPMKRVK